MPKNTTKKGTPLYVRLWWNSKQVVSGILGNDGTFRRTTKYMLEQPPAHCLDASNVEQLARLGCKSIEITHIPTGNVYKIPFETFLEKTFPIERGRAGKQRACTLENFVIEMQIESSALKAGQMKRSPARKPRQHNPVKPDRTPIQLMLGGNLS